MENKRDIDLILIAQNAKKFGVEFMENSEILKMLLTPKNKAINSQNLAKIREIFTALEEIKTKNQLSKN